MKPEPSVGFNDSFLEPIRTIRFKAALDSHNYLTAIRQNGYILFDSVTPAAAPVQFASTTDIESVALFLARESGFAQYIDILITGDNAGAPDMGNIIAQGVVLFGNKHPRFYEANLMDGVVTTFTASAGVPYWIVPQIAAGTVVRWLQEDTTLVYKTRDVIQANNIFEIPDLTGFSLNLSQKIDADAGTLRIGNQTGESIGAYSDTQPMRALFDHDRRVFISIGNATDYLRVATMLVRDYEVQGANVTVSMIATTAKAIVKEPILKLDFFANDLSVAAKDLLDQAGISYNPADIEDTGSIWPSYGTVGKTIIETLNKIAQAADYEFRFDSDGMPFLSAKPSIFNPDFTLHDDDLILDRDLNVTVSTDYTTNRALIHNGQATDEQGNLVDLEFDEAIVFQNYAANAGSVRTVDLSIDFSPDAYRAQIRDNLADGTYTIQETSRSNRGLKFTVFNNRYPNEDLVYDIDVIGQTLLSTGSNLRIFELARPNAINQIGIFDYTESNDLFRSTYQIQKALDDLLLFNSLPRRYFSIRTRGMPTLECGDFVDIEHKDTNSELVCKIRAMTIECVSAPRSLLVTYEIESFPFFSGTQLSDFINYADSGLTADSGIKADTQFTVDYITY